MFDDRHAAGKLLVPYFEKYRKQDAIIIGLARGGVVVAYEVAKALDLPLNVVVPRKIGAPGNPELAVGAIMENGEGVFNDSIIRMLGITKKYIDEEIEKEKIKANSRLAKYRKEAPLPSILDHTVVLIDDGIATGATMLAAIKGMRLAHAKEVIVAIPVSSVEALHLVEQAADEVVCLHSSIDFFGVSQYYHRFEQTEDDEVVALLNEINHP